MHNSISLIPWWVFPILIFLVIRGTRLCSPCTVKIRELLVLPLVFFLVSVHHFMKPDNISFLNVSSLMVGMGLGSYMGYLYKRNYPIKIDRVKGLIYLPADKTLLVLLLLSFGIEIFMSLTESLRPYPYWWLNPIFMLASGLITGIVIGGNATHLYRYLNKKAPLLA